MSSKGIDISKYQAGIKMSAVKKNFDLVILRGGYTGYGADRKKVKDPSFETFYKQAKAEGLNVGVYWYSCANNKATGKAEAKFLYENCLKGKKFEMPIYIDVENSQWQTKSKKGVTDAIIAFCEYLEDKGYYVGIYASLSWFGTYIDTSRVKAYTKWIAKWSDKKPTVNFDGFEMWQYSDSGKAGGKTVDLDTAYVDFPSTIKSKGFNGYKATKTTTKPSNSTSTSTKAKTYTVKAGDTLSAIAKKYNTTVDALVKKNNVKDKNLIYAGQVLNV